MSDATAEADAAQAELRRRFLATLARTQYMPPAGMARYQASLLHALLRHAVAEVPFYRDGRLAPVLRPDGDLDMTRWHQVPVLTRQDVFDAGALLHANTTPAVMGEIATDMTSGSTGLPITIRRSAAAGFGSTCCGIRHVLWHDVDRDGLHANLTYRRPHQDDARPTGGAMSTIFARQVTQTVSDASIDTFEWLRTSGARYLTSYPSPLAELARDIVARGRPRIRLDAIFTYGEMLSPECRQVIEEAFGARVIDRYATEETGLIAGECPHGRLHVASEINLVEIVDEDGLPVGPGTAGRVVVTSLYNYAMPLIRYAVGDYALRPDADDGPCACGLSLPVLGQVLGRTRDMFRFVDGSRAWPIALSSRLSELVPLIQYQMVQHSLTDIEFRYRPKPGGVPDFAAAEAYIRSCLHPSVRVRFSAVATIPREPSGKFRDYVCRLES